MFLTKKIIQKNLSVCIQILYYFSLFIYLIYIININMNYCSKIYISIIYSICDLKFAINSDLYICLLVHFLKVLKQFFFHLIRNVSHNQVTCFNLYQDKCLKEKVQVIYCAFVFVELNSRRWHLFSTCKASLSKLLRRVWNCRKWLPDISRLSTWNVGPYRILLTQTGLFVRLSLVNVRKGRNPYDAGFPD